MATSPLHIAFVSYEYAGIAAGGGIGTYVRNAAAALAGLGHRVEVFTEGPDGTTVHNGVTVHTTAVDQRAEFPACVASPFAVRHIADPFDVVEAAEYGADASRIAEAFPNLPLVVKLHTPSSLISEINHQFVPWSRKARFLAGALIRGQWPRPYWHYNPAADPERAFTLRAHEITSPSQSLLEKLRERWGLDSERLAHVPNVFIPPSDLLAVPVETQTDRVTFIGKLEVRKGVTDLAEAIPRVLAAYPEARFRLIGRSLPHPGTGEDLTSDLQRRIGRHADAVEFVEAVSYDEVPAYYADTDVCVFPSVWENFPNVCLEAMAAARGVVASSSGGMAEMVDDGVTGRLVAPGNPDDLADAIIGLLADPARRIRMGTAARRQSVERYSAEAIGPLQEVQLSPCDLTRQRCTSSTGLLPRSIQKCLCLPSWSSGLLRQGPRRSIATSRRIQTCSCPLRKSPGSSHPERSRCLIVDLETRRVIR